MNEIIKIVEKCMKERTIISETQIFDIINFFVDENNLSEYVSQVKIVSGMIKNKKVASYDYNVRYHYDNYITIYLGNFVKSSLELYKGNTRFKNLLSFENYYNYYLLNVIFHELRHAMQRRIIYSNKNDVISQIYIYDDEVTDNYERVLKFYNIGLAERNARVFEKMKSFEVFNSLADDLVNKDILNLIQSAYMIELLNGYCGICFSTNPLRKFVFSVNNLIDACIIYKYFKDRIDKENIPLNERLNLGLPLGKAYKKVI